MFLSTGEDGLKSIHASRLTTWRWVFLCFSIHSLSVSACALVSRSILTMANLSLRGASGSPASLGSDRTRALQPCITGEGGADFDLLQGIIVNLRSRDVPSLTLCHDGDLLFLAIGSVNRAVFGDLKIALALDGSVGWFE